ncbi:MAG TPA: radical SAM protein, partial [Candidatus Binatia bacterium]
MKNFVPEEIIVESGSDRGPIYRNLKRAFPEVPFVIADRSEAGAPPPTAFGAAKRRLLLARHRGEFLKKCPGSDGQVCCNYFVINFASNCSMDCSYCYLQEYLADNPALKVFGNVDDLIAEADAMLGRHRKFFFRIGTGEITDSLALDPYIGFSAEVVPFFAEQPNVLLELKTKSDCVDGLLGLDPKDRVVVSWSMNPQRVIDADEHGTASLEERLSAARRCQAAGYRLGFHFDPMVEYPGWESDYRDMVEKIFAAVDHKRVSWVSLGVLRTT